MEEKKTISDRDWNKERRITNLQNVLDTLPPKDDLAWLWLENPDKISLEIAEIKGL